LLFKCNVTICSLKINAKMCFKIFITILFTGNATFKEFFVIKGHYFGSSGQLSVQIEEDLGSFTKVNIYSNFV
jgi:hypothetical protein